MKIHYIILSIVLSGLNCNKSKPVIENLIRNDSIVVKNEVSAAVIEVIDSFIINHIQFRTLNINRDSLINGTKLSHGSYLIALHNNINSISLIDIIKNAYPIHSGYMEKKYFFDISSKLDLEMQAVLKYAYHGEAGPIDLSEIFIIYVQKDKVMELCQFMHWDDYYNELNIIKSNDSIYSIKYNERDRYGYFHSDYLIIIDKNKMQVKYVTPDVQKTCFQTVLMDTLKVYMTKDEAVNQKAINNSILLNPGERIIIDSIYWRLNILKIDIIKGAEGFVNMDEIGKSIDGNRAG